jgi:2-amino-4-hydroxy-6-hydroxymethyldihydropteridine diphosphokinase
MVSVFVSVASNYQTQVNIGSAIGLIGDQFGELRISNAYRNQSINAGEADYVNLVVGFDTEWVAEDVVKRLKAIERDVGRCLKSKQLQQITIDLDLIIYGDYRGVVDDHQIPAPNISSQSFILGPLAELAGTKVDSHSGVCYQNLWHHFDKSRHPLEKIQLNLR